MKQSLEKEQTKVLFISAHGNTNLPYSFFNSLKNLYFLCDVGDKISGEQVNNFLENIINIVDDSKLENTIISELAIKHGKLIKEKKQPFIYDLAAEKNQLEYLCKELDIVNKSYSPIKDACVSLFKGVLKNIVTTESTKKEGFVYIDHNLSPDSGNLTMGLINLFREHEIKVYDITFYKQDKTVTSPLFVCFNPNLLHEKKELTFISLILKDGITNMNIPISELLPMISDMYIFLQKDKKPDTFYDPFKVHLQEIAIEDGILYNLEQHNEVVLGVCRSFYSEFE